jgi:hypothetical protein
MSRHKIDGVRSQAPFADEEVIRREVERLKRTARDLRIGLENLTDLARRGEHVEDRRVKHGAKLARVENRIFQLRQRRML